LETITKAFRPILALSIDADQKGILITTEKGNYFIEWSDCSDRLAKATNAERIQYELSPSGYGIHWPLIDEDLSVSGLMQKAKRISS